MLKQKRILALLVAALTLVALSTAALAVFDLEGVELEGVAIKDNVQVKDSNGKKAGKLNEGDTVTIVGAYGDNYFIVTEDDWYQIPMSGMAVFYDEAYQGTAKKSIKVYSDIIAKSKYLVGTIEKGSQFNVFGRIGNWYVLYMADTEQLVYVQVKNVDVYTGREGS